MRKKIDVRKNICLLGAVIMLGACGQAESGDATTAAEKGTQAVETTVAEKESGDKDAAEKKENEAANGKDAEGAEDTKETKEGKDSADKNDDKEQETDKDGGAVKDANTANGQQAETNAQGADAAGGSNTQGADAADGSNAQGADAAGGSNTQTEADPQAPGSQQGGKSVAGIYEEITQKVSLVSPMVVPDDFISNYYGIDVSTLDEYVFSMSEAAISAETIVILKAKDSGSTGALSAALQTVIDQKRSEMENYLPDQFQIVDKSSVQVKGDYVYLVISEQAAAIEPIIQAGIS